MEENNNMDTPQPQTANTNTGMDAFGAPELNDGSSDNLSVADAFFSQSEPASQEAPETGTPNETQENTVNTPIEPKNDDTRYEYWQSQAAKKDNELKALQQQVQQAVQQQQAAPVEQTKATAEEFPPPPPKPEKPRGFNRQEAWDDPSSESARYLDEMDDWNGQINEYRDIKQQYELAIIKEQMMAQEEAKYREAQKQQALQAQKQQVAEVYNHVKGHYGFTQEEAREFVKSMADPSSISMDNLVQLYRMNKGAGQVNTQSQGPSEAFQQSRNAQQVPSPMGVMPSQATESNRSDTDMIMDDLINTHKSKNPWS